MRKLLYNSPVLEIKEKDEEDVICTSPSTGLETGTEEDSSVTWGPFF